VLVNQGEPAEVRINVLKQLRNGRLQPLQRQTVAEAVLQVVLDGSSPGPAAASCAGACRVHWHRQGAGHPWRADSGIRVKRSTCATLRSRHSSGLEPRRSASRYFASCRRMSCSVRPPEVSCCHGDSK
jgi:hypothetical protein